MRILVIQNKKYKSTYAASIYALLEALAHKESYAVQQVERLDDIQTAPEHFIAFVTLNTGSFFQKLIQQQQLSSFIKENNIQLLIQNAASIIKQKTAPQLLIADDIEQLPAVKKISYSKIFLLTYSGAARQAIIDKGFTNIVHVVPFTTNARFQPINWSMKQQVKIDLTEGREYFITTHHFKSMDEVLMLLKAFSGFKKWQHSSMKLVLTGKLHVPPGDWEDKWSTYKYREDVLVYNKLSEEEKWRLLAGAYACIHLPENDGDVLPLLQALQCHTPVIAPATASGKEYASGAMLVAAKGNSEDLAQQMIAMYKDENMRNNLVASCVSKAAELSGEKALQLLESFVL